MSAKVQRLRITYARGLPQRYVSHLDMIRFWERALRRARLPVAYSEGFTPHPQIALGPPLGLGMTGRAELLDVFLSERVLPDAAAAQLREQMPQGIEIVALEEVPLEGPALQALVRAADYRMYLRPDADLDAVFERIAFFLASTTVPWEHQREKEIRRYDLRPLVLTLLLDRDAETGPAVLARLRAEEGATARPDQVARALEIADDVTLIERVGIVLATPAAPR